MKLKLALSLLVSFLLFTNTNAQDEWQDYVSWAWGGKYSPYIEAVAGFGLLKHQDFTSTFANVGTAELKLGFTELKDYKGYIQSLDERYLFGTYISSDILQMNTPDPNDVKSEGWRFGMGNRLGFGYKIGPFSLIPYHQSQFSLTNMEFTIADPLLQSDQDILNRMEGDFRMGITYEGGVKFYIAKSISIDGSVEGAVIFPRFKVLHWLGSFALQSMSLGAVSYFAEAIVNSSPFLGPLMYFVLKNGLSLAWYYAMKDQMYWPIESEAPLTMETIRLGASFTF